MKVHQRKIITAILRAVFVLILMVIGITNLIQGEETNGLLWLILATLTSMEYQVRKS